MQNKVFIESRDIESWYCFQYVCLSACVPTTKKRGCGDMSCSVDHREGLSGCVILAELVCLFLWVSNSYYRDSVATVRDEDVKLGSCVRGTKVQDAFKDECGATTVSE